MAERLGRVRRAWGEGPLALRTLLLHRPLGASWSKAASTQHGKDNTGATRSLWQSGVTQQHVRTRARKGSLAGVWAFACHVQEHTRAHTASEKGAS